MKSLTLPVTARTTKGKKTKELRQQGSIPAVLYGPKETPVALTIDLILFEKVLKEAGESTIVTLTGLDAPKDVLIHDVAFDAARGGVIHADFYAIEAGKELTVNVPLEFVGEPPAVKLGGTLTKVLYEVEVTCMPKDLPQHIIVDVSSLIDFDHYIHVKDLVIPQGVRVENDSEDIVVLVQAVTEDTGEVATLDMSAIEVEEGKD